MVKENTKILLGRSVKERLMENFMPTDYVSEKLLSYRPQGGFEAHRKKLAKAYKSGAALSGHTKSAHQGVFVETCQACQELYKKSGK